MTLRTDEPRLAPLEPPFDAGLGALLDRMNPPGAPGILALFRVLARHPRLAERLPAWGGFFLGRHATLPLRDREIVILRVCARCRAGYEWGVHAAAFGAQAALDEAQLRAIADPASALEVLPERDRLLVRTVDALHDSGTLGDAQWAALARGWTEQQCIELLVLAGWYHAIAYVCNAARVPREGWAAHMP